MCGMKDGKSNSSHGFFYDDPTGKLLVWIGLGGRRKTSHWNEISEVSLSLVITAYKVMKIWYFVPYENSGLRQRFGEL